MKKITLLCAAGMSTSMLVKAMQKAADSENFACEIAAYPTSEAKEKAAGSDVVLLGPQVRFQKAKIQELLPGIPVDAIDMRMYGRMDGAGVLKFAKEKMHA